MASILVNSPNSCVVTSKQTKVKMSTYSIYVVIKINPDLGIQPPSEETDLPYDWRRSKCCHTCIVIGYYDTSMTTLSTRDRENLSFKLIS